MTKEEIIEAISEDKMMPFIQPEQLSEIVDFVIKSYQPSLPSNMDEAAEEHSRQAFNGLLVVDNIDAFKAGAEWMAGQGFTMGATFRIFDGEKPFVNFNDLKGSIEQSMKLFKSGDEVIVQIRKAK